MTVNNRPDQKRTETVFKTEDPAHGQLLVAARQVSKTSAFGLAPDSILTGLIGLVLLVVGLIVSALVHLSALLPSHGQVSCFLVAYWALAGSLVLCNPNHFINLSRTRVRVGLVICSC
jgi:hypothetical protein